MKLPRPSLSELMFVLWGLVIPLGFAQRLINGDGDMARHIRLGQLMLERGGVLHEDVFSWTRAGDGFLAFEWGSEVFFAAMFAFGGLALVAIASGIVLALSYALLCRFMLARGVEPVLAYLAVIGAVVMSSAHWVARPHLFTFLGVALLLPLLEDAKGRRAWLAIPLFAVWCNMHGGFVYGLVLVATYLGGDVLEAMRAKDRRLWFDRARANATVLLLGLGATFLNPNGIELHRHVRDFFGLTLLLEVTEEFQPPDFTSPTGMVMLGGILVIVGALIWSRRLPTWPRTGVILSNLLFGLRSRRNLALFGFVAFPLAALHIDPRWRTLPDRGGVREAFARDQAASRAGPWTIVALLVLGVLAASGPKPGNLPILRADFDTEVFPVEAVAHAREAGLGGRMFNDVTWGGYILLNWPEQRVFLDGGTDHYGEALVADALRIAELEEGWQEELDALNVAMVILPPRALLIHELARDSGWQLWYCDQTAAIVRRTPGVQTAVSAVAGAGGPGCPAASQPAPPQP